jgi:hypothetical protein
MKVSRKVREVITTRQTVYTTDNTDEYGDSATPTVTKTPVYKRRVVTTTEVFEE